MQKQKFVSRFPNMRKKYLKKFAFFFWLLDCRFLSIKRKDKSKYLKVCYFLRRKNFRINFKHYLSVVFPYT